MLCQNFTLNVLRVTRGLLVVSLCMAFSCSGLCKLISWCGMSAVSKIQQVLKVCEIQDKLQSSHQSAAGDLTAGITFVCLTSFDVDTSSPSFIVRRWSVCLFIWSSQFGFASVVWFPDMSMFIYLQVPHHWAHFVDSTNVFMPLQAISCRRHSVFRLSVRVYVRPCVIMY